MDDANSSDVTTLFFDNATTSEQNNTSDGLNFLSTSNEQNITSTEFGFLLSPSTVHVIPAILSIAVSIIIIATVVTSFKLCAYAKKRNLFVQNFTNIVTSPSDNNRQSLLAPNNKIDTSQREASPKLSRVLQVAMGKNTEVGKFKGSSNRRGHSTPTVSDSSEQESSSEDFMIVTPAKIEVEMHPIRENGEPSQSKSGKGKHSVSEYGCEENDEIDSPMDIMLP